MMNMICFAAEILKNTQFFSADYTTLPSETAAHGKTFMFEECMKSRAG